MKQDEGDLPDPLKTILWGWVREIEGWVRGRSGIDAGGIHELLILEYMLPLGCCVHLTPAYEAIKQWRPDVKLTVATRGLGAELLRHHRFLDRLLLTPDPLTDLVSAATSLRGQLRNAGISPDCVLTGASDQRSRIALMAVAACRRRGGFSLLQTIYQYPLDYDADLSLIDNNLRLGELVGAERRHVEPKVYFSSKELEHSRELILGVSSAVGPLVVMVTQGSGGQRTGWHMERFKQVVEFAAQELGAAVVFVGTGGDREAIEEIREATGGIGVSVAGKTSVTELAALLAMSDAVVTLDTGTMHVGRAVDVPMVVLGPSWQRPLEWLPLGKPNVRILRGPDRDFAPEGYRLDEISAADAKEALAELLQAFPPSLQAREARVQRGLSDVDLLAGTTRA